MTDAQLKFLQRLLAWKGVATSREIGPQLTQQDNSARQACKRNGFVRYDGHYWRLTEAGRDYLKRAAP